MNGINERDVGQAINALILNVLSREMHTAMPGRVESVQGSNPRTVNVKPLLKYATVDGKQTEFDIINGVMLLTYGSTISSVTMPVQKGDLVLLIFCERSTEKWARATGVSDSELGRQFDLSDAFAIPFNFAALESGYNNEDMIVKHQNSKITMKHGLTGDTVEIANSTSPTGAKATLLPSGNVAIETAPLGLITLNGKAIADGGTLTPLDGVVTGMCSCSITGAPHPVVSLTVLAKGLVP
jgi:hypothetical protein